MAGTLHLPLSKVYGAATFYSHFMMKPQGAHVCVVCTGTACYIKGATELLKSIEAGEHLKPGETTGDGQLSLLTARCFGACRPGARRGAGWRSDHAGYRRPTE